MRVTEVSGSSLARIRAFVQGGSESTRRIAQYILDKPERVRSMPIGRLADACRSSASTVSRFCTALGYAGYKEFQLDLAATLAQEPAATLEPFTSAAAPEVICQHVFEQNRRSLVETESLLDTKRLVRVAQLIWKARRTMFLGVGGSGLVAEEAAQRLMSLGVNAMALVDPYEAIFATGTSDAKDVVVGISHTGATAVVVDGLREARRRKSMTVALTNCPQSPLAEAADHVLVTVFQERRINAAVSSSRVAQICIVDALYFILGSWGSDAARALSESAEKRVQNMLRIGPDGRRRR